jgi:hypothetical protein
MDLVEPEGDERDLGPGKSDDHHQEGQRYPDEIAEPTWPRTPGPTAESSSNERRVRVRQLSAGFNIGHEEQTRDAPLRSHEARDR